METKKPTNLSNRLGALTIDNTLTDLAVLDFDDRQFILVTQYEKVGSLVSVTSDVLNTPTAGSPSFTTKVLFGKDEIELHTFARFVAEKLQPKKPVLFGVALKKWPSPEELKLLSQKLLQIHSNKNN